MLASITPLGERGRGRSWGRTVTAWFVGALLGGAALGAVAGAAAWVASAASTPVRWVVAVVVAVVVVALSELGRLPSWRRQVDVRWLSEYRGWVVGLGYGAQLGAAVVTIVPTAATWLMLVVAVASGSVPVAVVLCVVFAVARAVPLLWGRTVVTPAALHDLHQRLNAWAAPVDAATRIVAGAATCGLLAAAVAVRAA